MKAFISPNYTQEKLDNPTIDDLIDVFKDRVVNWLFDPAKKLITEKHGSFAALCLLLTYFEGIWTYMIGADSTGNSKRYFKKAFLDVFRFSGHPPHLLNRIALIIYKDGRCGFFHDGMLRGRIFLTALNNQKDLLVTFRRNLNGNIDVNGKIESILIDPKHFMATIERHFTDYLLCLRNPEQKVKRENFLKIAKEKWDYEGEAIVIGLNNDGSM